MHSTHLTSATRKLYESRSFPELSRLQMSIMIERAATESLNKIHPVRKIKSESKCGSCNLIYSKRFGSCPNC